MGPGLGRSAASGRARCGSLRPPQPGLLVHHRLHARARDWPHHRDLQRRQCRAVASAGLPASAAPGLADHAAAAAGGGPPGRERERRPGDHELDRLFDVAGPEHIVRAHDCVRLFGRDARRRQRGVSHPDRRGLRWLLGGERRPTGAGDLADVPRAGRPRADPRRLSRTVPVRPADHRPCGDDRRPADDHRRSVAGGLQTPRRSSRRASTATSTTCCQLPCRAGR